LVRLTATAWRSIAARSTASVSRASSVTASWYSKPPAVAWAIVTRCDSSSMLTGRLGGSGDAPANPS
jgi:hypothetical protein